MHHQRISEQSMLYFKGISQAINDNHMANYLKIAGIFSTRHSHMAYWGNGKMLRKSIFTYLNLL